MGVHPSILVVDAHAVMASALTIALRHAGFDPTSSIHPDVLELGEADEARSLSPGDIVLLGLLYGDGRNALRLIRPLARRGCRIIVMTVQQGLPLVGECLHLGAEAVLDEEMSFEKLVSSLRRLVDGGELMTEEDRRALLQSVERHQAAELALVRPFSMLTEREAEILESLVDGSSPKQIAHGARISISTVRGHIQRTLTKLDVSSQREALAMARAAGWPPAPVGDLLLERRAVNFARRS
jgi:DNA-binding NarL/FixJ family response regulator